MAKAETVYLKNMKLDLYKIHIDMPYADKIFAIYFAKLIETFEDKNDIVFLCIGTDMILGDSLGPLAGEILTDKSKNLIVYGTLEKPVHAVNLQETLEKIYKKHKNPLIVAIDAGMGRKDEIGTISIMNCPLKPGAAVGKNLPEVGDISVVGIVGMVNTLHNPDKMLIHCTRLYLIYKMAKIITDGIEKGIKLCNNYNGNYHDFLKRSGD